MAACKPVEVSKGAFAFCRYSLAVLVWAALIFQWKWMVWVCFAVLALSAILKVKRAPMILLYEQTIERLFPSGEEILDENGMRFAHTLGAVLCLLALGFLYLSSAKVGWIVLFFVAVIKTIGALGLCAASKLYGCMTSGGCCRFTRRRA